MKPRFVPIFICVTACIWFAVAQNAGAQVNDPTIAPAPNSSLHLPADDAELLRYIDSVSTDRRLFLPMLWEAYHEQRLPVSKKISAQGNGAEEDWFQVIELPRHPRSQGQEPSCRAKEGTCYLVHASQGKLEMVDSFHLVSAPVLSFQSKNSLLITEEDGKDATVYRKRFRLYQISKTGEVKGPEILQYHRVTGSAAQQSGGDAKVVMIEGVSRDDRPEISEETGVMLITRNIGSVKAPRYVTTVKTSVELVRETVSGEWKKNRKLIVQDKKKTVKTAESMVADIGRAYSRLPVIHIDGVSYRFTVSNIREEGSAFVVQSGPHKLGMVRE